MKGLEHELKDKVRRLPSIRLRKPAHCPNCHHLYLQNLKKCLAHSFIHSVSTYHTLGTKYLRLINEQTKHTNKLQGHWISLMEVSTLLNLTPQAETILYLKWSRQNLCKQKGTLHHASSKQLLTSICSRYNVRGLGVRQWVNTVSDLKLLPDNDTSEQRFIKGRQEQGPQSLAKKSTQPEHIREGFRGRETSAGFLLAAYLPITHSSLLSC